MNQREEGNLSVHPIQLELGLGLVTELDKEGQVTLKERIEFIRNVIQERYGIILPLVRVVDNSTFRSYTTYQIKIKDVVVSEGELKRNRFFAFKTPYTVGEIQGEEAKDPVYGEDGLWIEKEQIEQAKEVGYKIAEPIKMLSADLLESVKNQLDVFLTRQNVADKLRELETTHPILLSEMEKYDVSLFIVQGVLKKLLQEKISVKDLPSILEYIIDGKMFLQHLDDIYTFVREKMSAYITQEAKSDDSNVHAITLSTPYEGSLDTTLCLGEYVLSTSIEQEQDFMKRVVLEVQKAKMANVTPILLVANSTVRNALSKLFYRYNLPLPVLCANELSLQITVNCLSVIGEEE